MNPIMRHLPLHGKFVLHAAPVDINTGGAKGGNYNGISLRNHVSITGRVVIGAHSSTAVAITLQQMTSVEASAAKALSFTTYYSNAYLTSPVEERDMWVEQTASSDTFNIAANTQYMIPIKQAMLDVTNGFDCVRLHISAPGAATIGFWEWILFDGPTGIPGSTKHNPSVHVNRMDN